MRVLAGIVDLAQERWAIYRTTADDAVWTKYGGGAEGITDKMAREIHINASLPARAWPPVTQHELMHAVLFSAGLDVPMSTAKEEAFVVALAATMGHLLRIPRRPKMPESK